MFIELLPLLDGWKDMGRELQEPVRVTKGTEYILDKITSPGWVYSIQVTISGDRDAVLLIQWYDPVKGPMKASISPASLLALGFDMPNTSAPYISSWDDSTNTYTIAFTPAMPLPFKASPTMPRVVSVMGVSNDIEIQDFSQEGFVISNKEEFISSLKELMDTMYKHESISSEVENAIRSLVEFQRVPRW